LPTYGGLYAWEFAKGGRELKVRVEGSWCSTIYISLRMAQEAIFQDACFQPLINHPSDNTIRDSLVKNLAGINLAYLPEDVQTHLAEGRLIRVLADWCPLFPG
jgi:hypothetical protein